MITKKYISLALMVCSIQLSYGSFRAQGAGLDPQPLDHMVSAASVVAVAQISKFTPDADAQNDISPTGAIASRINGQGLLAPNEVIRLRGTYSVTIKARLKGKCPDNFEVHLPAIANFSFERFPFQIEEGASYILFLSQGADGRWIPVDPLRPLVPIGPEPTISKQVEDPGDAVIQILIESLADPKLRGISTFMLSETRGDSIVAAVKPYTDDPDLRLQDSVLCCLATNQVVEAIPRIAALQKKLSQARVLGGRAVLQLRSYQNPAATPYLNLLLFDTSASAREYAVLALRVNKIADKSSIPFLIVTLWDHSEDTSFQAYRLLHELIPDLGPAKDDRTYQNESHELEIQRVGKWWSDEIAGRHSDRPPLIRPRSMTPPIPSTRPNPGTTRGAAD